MALWVFTLAVAFRVGPQKISVNFLSDLNLVITTYTAQAIYPI